MTKFPLTAFICDLMRHGKPEVRQRWKAGHYPGVSAEWARWFAEVTPMTAATLPGSNRYREGHGDAGTLV